MELLSRASLVDEAVITGRAGRFRKVLAQVLAGSINVDGPLLVRSSSAGNATRWAQICRSVRDSLLRRSPSQRIAEHVVGVLVPVVLALGITAAIGLSGCRSIARCWSDLRCW